MIRKIAYSILLLFTFSFVSAQSFDEFFVNKTLRIDYIFSGNSTDQNISLDELTELPTWAGRKHNLPEIPLKGNGQIIVKDPESNKCIYRTSFSSLFQEWLSTDEATKVTKAFENSFLIPFPIKPVEVEVVLNDMEHKVIARLKHAVCPDDVLIHSKGYNHVTPHSYILKNGSEESHIDVVILAEGYTVNEMETFRKDAHIACDALFSHEPFKTWKKKFNVIAVESPSTDSGVSIPGKKEWKQTAFGSHFDTFYSPRYLTTPRVKSIHNALEGIPYEHIIILANTEQYGGGGIYNSYTLTTAHHPMFRPVVVHEFGHSFGGLADEYFYEGDTMSGMYPLHVEPWEQNITTLVDFKSKWEEMNGKGEVGLFEGGGYSTKGVYRPVDNCRMRTNEHPEFCPVCQRAIERVINFYTK